MGTEQSTLFLGSLKDRPNNAGNKSRCLLKEGVRVVWAAIKGDWTIVVSPKEKDWMKRNENVRFWKNSVLMDLAGLEKSPGRVILQLNH